MKTKHFLLTLTCVLTTLGAAAQDAQTVSATEHRWLFGVGGQNLLDTYLSPLEYTGTAVSLFHRSARNCRVFGIDDGAVLTQTSLNASYVHTPTDNGKDLDAQLSFGIGPAKNWQLSPRWRLTAGALLEGSLGFTYNTRNGNNPAQGRLALCVVPTVSGTYAFPLWHRTWTARGQVDFPLFGAMFSPNYGQSYYEIFSLEQTDHNVCLTHPFNAPSMRLLTTLDIPLGSAATLSLGYHADIRQSSVNHLKHHSWNHSFVIGFVRSVQLLKTNRRHD